MPATIKIASATGRHTGKAFVQLDRHHKLARLIVLQRNPEFIGVSHVVQANEALLERVRRAADMDDAVQGGEQVDGYGARCALEEIRLQNTRAKSRKGRMAELALAAARRRIAEMTPQERDELRALRQAELA